MGSGGDSLERAPPPATLRTVRDSDLAVVMSWIGDLDSCRKWGGPAMRYPMTRESFREDAKWEELDSFAWIADADGRLLGFGQIYERWSRVHLARLIVDPEVRGRGLGRGLVQALIEEGRRRLGFEDVSLFVDGGNPPALRCYRGLGFEAVDWPAEMPELEGVLFMIRTS